MSQKDAMKHGLLNQVAAMLHQHPSGPPEAASVGA